MIPKPFDTEEMDDLVHARGRLNILAFLFSMEQAEFMDIVRAVNLSRGSVSQHLKKLREAGYILADGEITDGNRKTTVRLTDLGNTAFQTHREKLRALLGEAKAASQARLAG